MAMNRGFIQTLLSSLVILSFKKKDKEDKNSGEPSLPSPMSEMSLGGGDLSLGGLGGGIGSLSGIELGGDASDALGDGLLSMSGSMQDDRKLQELVGHGFQGDARGNRVDQR